MKFECGVPKCSSRKPEPEIYENRSALSGKNPSSLRVMKHLQQTGLQEEKLYRELYMQNPSLYSTPVSSWSDFVLSWQNSTSKEQILPELAPTSIDTFFPEEGWFPDDNSSVAIVKNCRYCPPFWHSLAFVKLVYIVQGCGLLFLTDGKIELQQGDICIVAPDTVNAMFSCNDEDIILNIILRKRKIENILSNLLMEQNSVSSFFWEMIYARKHSRIMYLRSKAESDLNSTVFDLYDEMFCQSKPNSLMVNSYLNLMFGKILRGYNCVKDSPVATPHVSEGIKAGGRLSLIIQYMKANYQTITLPILAAHFGVSEGYMSRFIKQETGENFTSLLRRFRMENATQMLVNSDCTIEEIVEAIGYTDLSRFYRNFKSMYGMTPNQYRQRRGTQG